MTASDISVLRHRSPFGEWEIIARPPDPRLRPYVRGYERYVETKVEFSRRLEVPSLGAVLIINLGPDYRVFGPGNLDRAGAYGSFAAGLNDAHVVVESTGLSRGVQVNLTPIGAHLIFRLPMSDLTNRTVRLDHVLGAAGRRLEAQIEDTPDWPARFDILDAFFAQRIGDAPLPAPAALPCAIGPSTALAQANGRGGAAQVAFALERLGATGGQLGIGALAAEVGWSRKHLAAQFRDQIGLPPKTAARILRFRRAIDLLDGAGNLPWAGIAYRCGYFDQAHFNRDFRAFTGSSPREYVSRRLPDGGGVLAG